MVPTVVKYRFLCRFFVCFLSTLHPFINLQTKSLDGTVAISFNSKNYVFRNNDSAIGFVKLDGGATILSDSTVIFNTFCPISSGIDFGETGILNLDGDIYFDSGFTITSNGIIQGNGKAIYLGGDLEITGSDYIRIIHINSNTIVDGCGHELILGKRARLFVDDDVTLTLKNVILKPTFNYHTAPSIQLASHRSKLALENVIIDLCQDFNFMQGQLFIHDDVVIAGTSSFIYNSPQVGIITSGATLGFDIGTTFSISPATFTDCRFDTSPTYTDSNFIKMIDQTSRLYLNNCGLNSTHTGCKFTNGQIVLANKVKLNGRTALTIADNTPPTHTIGNIAIDGYINSCNWSPDGRFISLISHNPDTLKVFKFDEAVGVTQVGKDADSELGICDCAWSPDGRFIAEINKISASVKIYKFDGNSTPKQVGNPYKTGPSSTPIKCSWSPDGKFLALVRSEDNILQLLQINGTTEPLNVGQTATAPYPSNVAWGPNGKFIAIVTDSSMTIQIFSFDKINPPTLVGSVDISSPAIHCTWSPDGRFIATANETCVTLFQFNGNLCPTQVASMQAPIAKTYQQTVWAPNGQYFATACLSPESFRIFKFDGTHTPVQVGQDMPVATGSPTSCSWSCDGKFICITTKNSGSLQIFKVDYANDRSTQAVSNGITFGDKTMGSDHDLRIEVLAGASLNVVDGILNYQNTI